MCLKLIICLFLFSIGTCWSYVATDLFSAMRLSNQDDVKFRIFSSRYLDFYVNKKMRDKEAAKGERKHRHHCHGFPIERALKFIQDFGVPEEDPKDAENDYDCIKDAPERDPTILYKIGKQVQIRESNNLTELYKMLLDQPVGASLHNFHPEFTDIGSVSTKLYIVFFSYPTVTKLSI